MTENIGKVRIKDDLYPGEDLYSDGTVEDRLLEIARRDGADYDRIVSEEKDWAVMYHFSSLRENIITWYPVKKTDRVLEIGSGCGAVTGALSRMAGEVTCVELSKKRSLINAARNRAHANIEIVLGNFEEVERTLPDSYDIATLIGVFEYGSGYISGDDPYVTFLRKTGQHLLDGGRILIAIENRLGLKYWAGCAEDHTGRFFEGLEGYTGNHSVRTFAKPELEEVILRAGFTRYRFYYPYPDYKFPAAIYSDEYLPGKGELRQNRENYDRMRLMLFDEARVFDSLLDAGLFPVFSNSFFVEITKTASK